MGVGDGTLWVPEDNCQGASHATGQRLLTWATFPRVCGREQQELWSIPRGPSPHPHLP